ncbi:MAG: hypothetical protein WBD31_00245, partial [Rubripirellula sp.]
ARGRYNDSLIASTCVHLVASQRRFVPVRDRNVRTDGRTNRFVWIRGYFRMPKPHRRTSC